MSMQYQLDVKNGKIEKEDGFFFKAAPFQVITSGKAVDVTFKKGDDHKVVYEVKADGKVLFGLVHPDYIPETPANDLSDLEKTIFAALFKIGVSSGQPYAEFFKDVDGYSFEVKQPVFIS